MDTCRRANQVLVISPPPKMLEYFLLTGRWPSDLKFMAVLSDQPSRKEERHGGKGPACPGC